MTRFSCLLLASWAAFAAAAPQAFAECNPNYSEPKNRDSSDVVVALKVDDVGDTFDKVLSLVRAAKGKVGKQTKSESPRCSDGRIVAEIPTAKVRPVVIRLRKLGEVLQESMDYREDRDAVEIEIKFSDRDTDGYGHSSRATFFAGVTGGVLAVSGIAGDLKRPGAGVVMATERQWAQLSLFVLEDGKEDEADTTTTASDGDKKKKTKGSSMALVSHEFYSSVLGDGNRTFMNPYAGFSYGYAHLDGVSAVAIAGNLGVELVKVRYVAWSVTGSLLSFFNSGEGGTGRLYTTQLSIPF